jgi:hypothetical protein
MIFLRWQCVAVQPSVSDRKHGSANGNRIRSAAVRFGPIRRKYFCFRSSSSLTMPFAPLWGPDVLPCTS